MPRGAVSFGRPRPDRDGAPIGRRELAFSEALTRPYRERCPRADALGALRAAAGQDDVIVATTGYTSRELYTLGDADNQLYLVGSMGSASAFALGLALHQPRRRVWLADGDGAALMRMGNLASIGALAPRNLFHIVLDNEAHESTGGKRPSAPACRSGRSPRPVAMPAWQARIHSMNCASCWKPTPR